MKSNTTRVMAGIAVVAVAVLLLIVLKDDGKSASEEAEGTNDAPAKVEQSPAGNQKAQRKPAIPTIVIEGGKPVGGIAELTFNEGDRIRFEVESDVSDEIHVHGYDLMQDVEAGGKVRFDFPATIEGVFEAELEERKQPIAELTVNP
ncbi:MAG TPA: hypothetical protein VF093_00620 [Solirubrobacterales bacterium]